MTLRDLEQYENLKKEITDIEKRIQRLRAKKNIVSDTVRGSMKYFPYTERTITVTGVGVKDEKTIRSLASQLRNRQRKYEKKTLEIEDFIETLDDCVLRRIIELKYIDGLTWLAVARMVCGSRDESTPRKKVSRFFEKK